MYDTIEKINCPACHKEMHKIFIPSANINIDICLDGCGGIYFDNREFDSFNETHEDIQEILDVIKNKNFETVSEYYTRVCPVCGANMVKNSSSIKKIIEIDECYSCGGKFLDNQELIKIRNEYDTDKERAAAAVSFLYDEVGAEWNTLKAKNALSYQKRSIPRKIFDNFIYGIMKNI